MSARTDRNRKAAPPVSDESQLWQVVKGHLRAMDTSEQAVSQLIRDVEKKRQAYIEQQQRQQGKTESEGNISKDVVRSLYHQLENLYEEDLQETGKALEKLEVLMAIRDDPSSDAATKRKKRKTDTSISVTSSTSPPLIVTPAKERQISPMTMSKEESNTNSTGSGSSLLPPPTTEREKKRSNSKSNGSSNTPVSQQQQHQQRRGTISASAKDAGAGSGSNGANANLGNNTQKDNTKDSTTSTSSSGTSTGYVDPARARREVLAHQLPLQKGRKVAFRQPPKTKSGPGAANVSNMTSRSASSAAASAAQGSAAAGAGTGAGSGQAGNGSGSGAAAAAAAAQEDEGEQWIMATIIECINNDRNRYVVVDAEDAAMPTYNTTLKAIVPLPESLTTLPLEDYKVGTQVMGLYPDTSCFYQAIVQSGGPGMNGKIMAKMQRRADEILHTPYQLIFEDDGDAIQDVPACFVVERP